MFSVVTARDTAKRTRQRERMNAMLPRVAKSHSQCKYSQTELVVKR